MPLSPTLTTRTNFAIENYSKESQNPTKQRTPFNPANKIISASSVTTTNQPPKSQSVTVAQQQQPNVFVQPQQGRAMAYAPPPPPPAPTAEVQYPVDSNTSDGMYHNSAVRGVNYAAYGDGNTIYTHHPTAVSTSYYEPNQANVVTSGAQMIGQVSVSAGPGTYVVPQAGMKENYPVPHTTRAPPATVQWLLENYETAEGVSLPRSLLYSHYIRHCDSNKLDPVNAASFGKLIRSVFLGLKTRRLGTRGNSKYHYYGIRIKLTSPLNNLQEDWQMAMRQQPTQQIKRFKSGSDAKSDGDPDNQGEQDEETEGSSEQGGNQQHQHQQFLGDTSRALPNFETLELDDSEVPNGITPTDVVTFAQMYREHCEAILNVIVNLQFNTVITLWKNFWRCPVASGESEEPIESDGSIPEVSDKDRQDALDKIEQRLSKEKLIILCSVEKVVNYLKACDYCLYQALVDVLVPDVLRPIPSALTQAIRNFAKNLETQLSDSMVEIPAITRTAKLAAVNAFSQTLRRYTSLNHLAQATRAVLQNANQITQMLNDLNRVDFSNVHEQASWVCQCDEALVNRLEADFKTTLQQQKSLEQWSEWLNSVVDSCLQPFKERDEDFAKAAREFLLKWSFYSSMVIRDLTLRSAASFGSFHLIRLLYDEYMFYIVEHRVAIALNQTPITVMAEQLASIGHAADFVQDPGILAIQQSATELAAHSSSSIKDEEGNVGGSSADDNNEEVMEQ